MEIKYADSANDYLLTNSISKIEGMFKDAISEQCQNKESE